MTLLRQEIADLQRRFSGRSLEWYSAVTLFLFGFALLLPGETFTRSWYRHMAELGCEWTWGAGMMAAGIAQAFAIHFCRGGGAYWCRIIACTVSCVIWGYISLPLLWASPVAAGAVPYFTLALAMSFTIARGRPV